MNLKNKLVEITKNECSEKYGYVLGIVGDCDIIDNKISPATSQVVFTVRFDAITIKPVEGEIVEGLVCMIFKGGIFINVEEKMKVLVPATTLTEFKLNTACDCFVKDKYTICKGSHVRVQILCSEYQNHKYSCYGKLVE